MRVRLLAPQSQDLAVTAVTRGGEAYRAQPASNTGDARLRAGVYLASMAVVVFDPGGEEYNGTALATVAIDEDLAETPRPDGEGES